MDELVEWNTRKTNGEFSARAARSIFARVNSVILVSITARDSDVVYSPAANYTACHILYCYLYTIYMHVRTLRFYITVYVYKVLFFFLHIYLRTDRVCRCSYRIYFCTYV